MRVILLLALTVAAVAAAPKYSQKIVGGSLTTIDQYPAFVGVLFTVNWSFYWQDCGGSIVNNHAVITAAHCYRIEDSPTRWRVRVGSSYASSGGVVHELQAFIVHPDYNRVTADSDIAILRLLTPITYNDNAQAGYFAGPNYNLADNQVVWTAGWGATFSGGPPSEQLQHVQIWTINQALCRERYNELGSTITDNMVCAGWLDVGGRDACQGDSGGPVYHNGVVVGVVSFGLGCADAYYPGVNVRVSRFISWIQANA